LRSRWYQIGVNTGNCCLAIELASIYDMIGYLT